MKSSRAVESLLRVAGADSATGTLAATRLVAQAATNGSPSGAFRAIEHCRRRICDE